MTVALERLVGFGRYLRNRGLAVGTDRVVSFCRAVAVLSPPTSGQMYWAARATLVSRREDLEGFDDAFRNYFASGDPDESVPSGVGERPETLRSPSEDLSAPEAPAAERWSTPESRTDAGDELSPGAVASRAEVLRNKSFDELSDEERSEAATMILRLAVDMPRRRARRLRMAARGRYFDLRRTLRHSLRTQGEPVHRAWRKRRVKMRPLVLVLDVSGSMAPHSRSLLQFAFAAMLAGHRVEAFCFGTRLTRVTPALRTKDPNRALKDIAQTVQDWEGGTRIGESVRDLLDRFGKGHFIRGAVVVLCSDGLERGDPELLAEQMRRLARRAHRVIWVNPLKGSPLYQPVARGMAAALPHVDVFLPGHNVGSLETLADVLVSDGGRLARSR